MNSTQRTDKIVAIAVAILLTVGCLVVLHSFVSALLWAVILCFVTWPTFLWGVRLLGGMRTLAATLLVLLIAALLVADPGRHAVGAADRSATGSAIRGRGPESGG